MTRFVIVSFGDEYLKYKNALVKSIKQNVKKHEIIDIELPALRKADLQKANYIKLKEWAKHIKGNTVLIDADTIVLSDISEVFDMPNDLIYTKRYLNKNIDFNSGVVFVKESGLNIINKWVEIDRQLYESKALLRRWQRKYFGFNQASFGCLLETNKDFNIGHVTTAIYNNCDNPDWVKNHAIAKIVHVKSTLRKSVNAGRNLFPDIEKRILKYYS